MKTNTEETQGQVQQETRFATWRGIDGRPLASDGSKISPYEESDASRRVGSAEELPGRTDLSEPDLAYIFAELGSADGMLDRTSRFTPVRGHDTMTYAASNLMHYPLYFEEVNLETIRAHHRAWLTDHTPRAPLLLNIAVLPYKDGFTRRTGMPVRLG